MPYLEPTLEAGAAFLRRELAGPVVMLNLLRFREQADYSGMPDLAPDRPVSGAEAYRRYEDHTRPLLEAVGGTVLFRAAGGPPLIGPLDERWDLVLLVRHVDVPTFLSFRGQRGVSRRHRPPHRRARGLPPRAAVSGASGPWGRGALRSRRCSHAAVSGGAARRGGASTSSSRRARSATQPERT